MSSLFGMIWTGVSGINASQVGLDVTGNNISNMKNENYSRQSVALVSSKPQYTANGQMGTGVRVEKIERAYDELLAKSMRAETTSYSYYSSLQTSLKEAMLYFNELESGSGLGDALQEYFDAWQDLANSATDGSDTPTIKRTTLIEKASTLTRKIQEGYTSLGDLKTKADYVITNDLADINLKIQSVAELNKQIALSEFANQPANDLRDARDALVDQISKFTSVTIYERENGQIALMTGGQAIVDGSSSYLLEATENPKTGRLQILWKSGNNNAKPVDITDNMSYGSLGANMKVRNELLDGYMKQLDELAATLITETNRIHSAGQGLERYTQITGTNGVVNPKFVLNSDLGKLPYKVDEGSFRINVYWSSYNDRGEATDHEFNIDLSVDPARDNMYSIIDKINMAAGGKIRASLSYENGLTLTAGNGYTIAFGEDTSGFLVASGMNGFFTGTSAKDINVSDVMASNPRLIASSKTGAEGDNQNAALLAKLGNKVLSSAGGTTISGFYGAFIGRLTSEKSQADIFAATKKMSSEQLSTRLQSIRGVSENDELLNMSLFQRVFEANSRYVNTVDEMLNTLINGLGTVGR